MHLSSTIARSMFAVDRYHLRFLILPFPLSKAGLDVRLVAISHNGERIERVRHRKVRLSGTNNRLKTIEVHVTRFGVQMGRAEDAGEV